MRLIGVLGGTSWPSTMLPYRLLNEEVQRRLGGHHSARVLAYSIDYHQIKSRYHDGWAEIPDLLRREIGTLLSFKPDCWLLANNTLHRAFDVIAHDLPVTPVFFHAVELVRKELLSAAFSRVLLLETKFTMEDGFFAEPLRRARMIVNIPDEPERDAIQKMQTRLSRGETDPAFAPAFRDIMAKHQAQGCEAVITACTELPLVVQQSMTGMRVVIPWSCNAALASISPLPSTADDLTPPCHAFGLPRGATRTGVGPGRQWLRATFFLARQESRARRPPRCSGRGKSTAVQAPSAPALRRPWKAARGAPPNRRRP